MTKRLTTTAIKCTPAAAVLFAVYLIFTFRTIIRSTIVVPLCYFFSAFRHMSTKKWRSERIWNTCYSRNKQRSR